MRANNTRKGGQGKLFFALGYFYLVPQPVIFANRLAVDENLPGHTEMMEKSMEARCSRQTRYVNLYGEKP